jgi:hypothetical protein
MTKARTTAGDHSNMNSAFKPVVSYAKTVGSAFADFGKAWQKSWDASSDITPGANARARAANKNFDAEKGQLVGAIFRGRNYDNKTGKQIKKK